MISSSYSLNNTDTNRDGQTAELAIFCSLQQKKTKPEKKELGVITYNIPTPPGEKKGVFLLPLAVMYFSNVSCNV